MRHQGNEINRETGAGDGARPTKGDRDKWGKMSRSVHSTTKSFILTPAGLLWKRSNALPERLQISNLFRIRTKSAGGKSRNGGNGLSINRNIIIELLTIHISETAIRTWGSYELLWRYFLTPKLFRMQLILLILILNFSQRQKISIPIITKSSPKG